MNKKNQPGTSSDTPKNEWTPKRIIIRLFLYPLCLLLIGLAIYALFNPVNWKSIVAAVGAMLIATVYLYSDIKLIIRHSKSDSKKKENE